MEIAGIAINYSNICKDYNTVYLDRDNKDRDTMQCMQKIVEWTELFLKDITTVFKYNIYRLSTDTPVSIAEVASKRFLFYSLEKGITLQSFVITTHFESYENFSRWRSYHKEGLLIQNDPEGESINLFTKKDGSLHRRLLEKLKDFTLEEL